MSNVSKKQDGKMSVEPMTKEAVQEAIKDVKIGSKLEAKWQETLDKTEEAIMVDKMNLEISEAIVKIAKKHIAEERETFK